MLFGGIADDITGGVELAAVLAAGGVRCAFVTDPGLVAEAADLDAVVVAQKTRTIAAAEARAKVSRAVAALREAGARQVFLKYCATFDSTPEGNIGPCADEIMEATGADRMLFVPAFPEARRYVFQAHLFVADQLVSESPKRFDPLTPMTDPDLRRVLAAQTARRVGHLGLEAIRAGEATLRAASDRLAEADAPYAIADATEDEDLARLAALTADWPAMSGGATVAGFYPQVWRARGDLPPSAEAEPIPGVEGPGVILAGSCADRTREQLDLFGAERPVLRLDLREAAGRDLAAEAAEWALARMGDGPVAVATSAAPEEVAAVQAALGRREAATLAEEILGRLAARLREAGARRFLVAGGETSGAVLDALGVHRLRVGPYEQAGVALTVSEGAEPLALCLKSGKLGPPDMFLTMLERMRRGG